MTRISPLLDLHEQGEGLLLPYELNAGDPADASASSTPRAGDAPPPPTPVLVAAFDPIEVEYAAIRRHAALFDQPHRATLVVRGDDRLEFLNRMLTQELSPAKGFTPFCSRQSFWLNRKGRIDADVRVIHLPDRLLLDCDVHAAGRARSGLESYVISEDVTISDESASFHRLALHGPGSAAIVARAAQTAQGDPLPPIADIAPGQVVLVRIADAEVVIDRLDSAGEIGLELLVRAEDARRVYEALSTPWSARANAPAAPQTHLARRVGWHALNIARIEAGTALYYLDYGPSSLPHEAGTETLHAHVSFKKGCYLGQEVVARMDALGHPKQRLVGLDIDPGPASPHSGARQAETGAPAFAHAKGGTGDDAPAVGAITSSCVSPMLGSRPIALAMIKWSHSTPGTKLRVDARPGDPLVATVRASLRAVSR